MSPESRYSAADFEYMERRLKQLHDRWAAEGKAVYENGSVQLLSDIVPELEAVWNCLDIETRGQLYAFFSLHFWADSYPYPEAAIQALTNPLSVRRQAKPLSPSLKIVGDGGPKKRRSDPEVAEGPRKIKRSLKGKKNL